MGLLVLLWTTVVVMVVAARQVSAPTHAHLTLPASKTDPFCQGAMILLATQPNAPRCMVTSLALLFITNSQPLHSQLFTKLDSSSLLQDTFISSLPKAGLIPLWPEQLSLPWPQFLLWCCLICCCWPLQLQAPTTGSWHSDVYCLYIDVPHDQLLALSAQFHWAVTATQPPKPLVLHFVHGLA